MKKKTTIPTTEKTFQQMTKKELKNLYKEYYDICYGFNACYGTSDIRNLDSIEKELDKRGININLTPNFN